MMCAVPRAPLLRVFLLGSFLFINVTAALAESGVVGSSVAAGIPLMSDSSSIAGASMKMFGGLFLCLGALAIVTRVVKKYGARGLGSGRRRLEVRERVMISSKASVVLVSLDNREFLVATGSESVSILSTNSAMSQMFAESLSEAEDEREVAHA